MKKCRLLSITLILSLIMGVLQLPVVGAGPTPEFMAHRIMSRSTVMRIDDPVAYAFNERHVLSDAMPYREGNTPMVPVRFIAESLHIEHFWESAEGGTFTMEQQNCVVLHISAGEPIKADGVEVPSPVLPVMHNGTLYAPAEALASALLISYTFDEETGLIFFSRWSEEERHSAIDYKTNILPYFDEANRQNEKTYLYVAVNGDDAEGDGSMEKPFATMARAKLAVRELNKNQKGDIIVYLRGGRYHLKDTILFEPADSGQNGYKVIYTAYEDEKVILDGSKEVTGWTLFKDNIYVADVPGEEDIHLIYENNQMAIKARHPNMDPAEPRTGYLQTKGTVDPWYGLSWDEGEIPYIENTKNLELLVWPGGAGGFWMWQSQLVKLSRFNQQTRKMKMIRQAQYELGAGSKYFLMGALEFLDQEGEFYHDPDAGKLYYIPRDYSILGKSISIPMVDDFIYFKGDSQSETVKNIEVSNMEICSNKRTVQLDRLISPQEKDLMTGNGVIVQNAENCSVLDCNLHDLGGTGVLGRGYLSNTKIIGNIIDTTAAAGIEVTTETMLLSSNNIFSNNLVTAPARIVVHAKGVVIQGGGDNFITHNRIYDIPRSAIQLNDAQRGHNYVAYNDLSDSNNSAEDTGIIYTIQQMEGSGSTVNNNYLHDSNAGFSGWSSIYSDEVSHSVRSQNNIISRVQTDGKDELGYYATAFLVKGRNYKVINNIMANAGDVPGNASINLADSQGSIPSEGYIIERNISYNHGPKVYKATIWTERTIASNDYNMYYDENDQNYTLFNSPVKTLDEWRTLGGYDVNSLTEDPKFMDAKAEDFRFRYDSRAKTLGIKTIKHSNIGLTEDFRYVDENDEISRLFISREGYSDTLSTINLKSGENASLKVTGRTENGFVKKPGTIEFTSDTPAVAKVNGNGQVTAVGPGKAKITATVKDGDNTSHISIYIFVDDEMIDFKLNHDLFIAEKQQTTQAIAIGTTRYGQILSTEDFDDIEFSLQNSEVASVNALGKITVITPGSSGITATATFNGKTMSVSAELVCVEHIITNTRLKLLNTTVGQGNETTCEVVGVNTKGEEVPLTGFNCKFTSLNTETVQVVQQNGTRATLMGVGSGKAQIKAVVTWYDKVFEATDGLTITAPNKLINDWKISNYKTSVGYVLEDEKGMSVYSNGKDIYRDEDDFTFVYREQTEKDLTIEATILDIDNPPANIASTGLMLRQQDTAGSFNVNLRYLPKTKKALVTWRTADFLNSADISVTDFMYSDPVKIRLQKKDNMIIASCMDSNGEWHVVKEVELALHGSYLAGITSFSGGNGKWFASRAEDIKIYKGAN